MAPDPSQHRDKSRMRHRTIMTIKGKVILVIGASSGVGKAAAKAFGCQRKGIRTGRRADGGRGGR